MLKDEDVIRNEDVIKALELNTIVGVISIVVTLAAIVVTVVSMMD